MYQFILITFYISGTGYRMWNIIDLNLD